MAAVSEPVQLHRTLERRHLGRNVRLERLEEDADILEAWSRDLSEKVDRMNARLLGVIISTASSAVLLAANLVVGRH